MAACGGSEPTTSTPDDTDAPVKIGMIANAFGTQSYNDDVLAGIVLASEEYEIDYLTMEVPEISDVANALRTLISQGVNLFVITTSDYEDGMCEVALEYPEVDFLYPADGLTEAPSNIMTAGYAENEAAFLAGALGALMTETNKIGAIMAIGDPLQYRYQYGYTAGAKYINSDVEVQTAFTNSYTDINKGQEVANVMYEKGCDYIGTYAGACNLGVFNAAKNAGEGKYVFGAANGQFDKMPEKIVASVVKPIDKFILNFVGEYLQGDFDTSKPKSLGLKENGVALLFTNNKTLYDTIPVEVVTEIENLTEKIIAGEIVVPTNEETYKTFEAGLGK